MSRDMNTKIAELLMVYKDNPVLAIESLFGVTVDSQQTDLILAACEPNARCSVKSAQGCGKTATLVWLSIYFLLTLEDCRVLITSPSAQQLSRVFHSELQKWHYKMPEPFKSFLDIKKETFNIVGKDYQMASLVTGSPTNQESLQGGHSLNYVILADEASGLEELVFDTLLGTLGAGEGKFIMTSNPVRNSGRFYEIFSRENPRWTRLTFDAITSTQCQQPWIDDMKEMYGEDDDNYQIRVLGNFGRMGENQFFRSNLIEEATKNELDFTSYHNFPVVAGVDVARYGQDSTVLVLRQGPKLLEIKEYRGLSTMEVAAKVVEFYNRYHPSSIFIDGIGIGAGVVDRCEELNLPVVDVVVSSKSSDPRKYANLRSQLYGRLGEWLENGADIPYNKELSSQLNSTSYTYNGKMQIQLMTKKDIKSSGLPSPDIVDSISLTMAGGTYGFVSATAQPRQVKRIQRRNWV